ncbi:MAG: hypothetical protein ACXWQ5_23375 [Ktedonobacterales bacterium]
MLLVARGRDLRDLATIGIVPLMQGLHSGHSGAVIQFDPHYSYYPGGVGYDGQYSYFLALDPTHAYAYMDYPAYRYTRILYPLAARLLALGQPGLIPYTLLLVNLLAMTIGTVIVARWLQRANKSPWLALFFGCCPGLIIALQHDLNEPLAYMLTVLGLSLLDIGIRDSRRPRWRLAGLAFAAAALIRETTTLIPFTIGVFTLFHPGISGERRGAFQLLTITFTPFLLYKLFLFVWLGSIGTPADMLPTPIPFGGLFHWWPLQGPQIIAVACVVMPALVAGGIVLRYSPQSGIALALVVQVLLMVFLPALSYLEIFSPPRITAGIPITTIFCLPLLNTSPNSRTRTWLMLAGGLWAALLPWLMITNFSYW